MDQYVAVVNSAVALERLKPAARKLWAETTVGDSPVIGAGPDPAPGTARVDIENVRATSPADKALQFPSLAGCLLQEVPALWERSAMVITRAAIETTRAQQQFGFCHASLLLYSRLTVARPGVDDGQQYQAEVTYLYQQAVQSRLIRNGPHQQSCAVRLVYGTTEQRARERPKVVKWGRIPGL